MAITTFEDLECWKIARALTKRVYHVSSDGLLSKDFDAKNQFRRASVSTMNNIAEGFGRFQRNDFKRFLEIALGSAYEVKSMLYLFEDLGYLSKEDLTYLHEQTVKLQNYLKALMKTLINQK
jgi:four helix bundle protein